MGVEIEVHAVSNLWDSYSGSTARIGTNIVSDPAVKPTYRLQHLRKTVPSTSWDDGDEICGKNIASDVSGSLSSLQSAVEEQARR